MKSTNKILILLISLLVLIGVIFAVKLYIDERVSIPKKSDAVPANNQDILSNFNLPAGFTMAIFANNVPNVRVMMLDSHGNMLVSQTKEGKISLVIDEDYDGLADKTETILSGLNDPHGMAMDCRENPCHLYIAEHNALSRYDYDGEKRKATNKIKLLDLEASSTDRHTTRTLEFLGSPDENVLLISVGSSCNVCNESGTMRGKILAYNIQTKELTDYATGLRNAVFMALHPVSGEVFATEMGRDGLGDNTPPDEINRITKGKNYGWPVCYGKNIHDTEFDKNIYIRNPCMEPFETPSWADLQAHSAPLGLAFIPEEGWPEDHWFNILVAYHGSWNRSVPTGYKIVRIKADAKGNYLGTEDFITGWLTPDGKKIGRPADILVLSGGVMYISDDEAGRIYKVTVN